jgi:hypothetical protein
MKVIVPCCGRSSRFPGQPPKWTLPAHDGRPMLLLALAGLKFSLDDLVVTILREHEERFGISAGLTAAFGRQVQMAILDQPTRSQSETVARTIETLDLDEPIFVKDSDGFFQLDTIAFAHNFVCVDTLNHFDLINPRNKSYVQVDSSDRITTMREKVVISDLFNVGGYFFTSPREFMRYYGVLANQSTGSELYLSNVIAAMLAENVPFYARRTSGYQDWGTAHEWRKALLGRKAYLVSLDGFAFERGSHFFKPQFSEVRAHEQAVAAIRAIAEAGHDITYLSIRPQSLEAITQAQMRAAGLPPGPVVWNCPGAQWKLLTAPHATLPFRTGQALELRPDAPDLAALLGTDELP